MRLRYPRLHEANATVTPENVSAHSQSLERYLDTVSAQALALVASPELLAAFEAKVRAQLAIDAAESLKYLAQVVRDEKQATTNRVAAARLVVDRAGYVPPKAAEQAKNAENPSEMSSDQLRRFIADAERELGARAVEVQPVTAQLDDMLS